MVRAKRKKRKKVNENKRMSTNQSVRNGSGVESRLPPMGQTRPINRGGPDHPKPVERWLRETRTPTVFNYPRPTTYVLLICVTFFWFFKTSKFSSSKVNFQIKFRAQQFPQLTFFKIKSVRIELIWSVVSFLCLCGSLNLNLCAAFFFDRNVKKSIWTPAQLLPAKDALWNGQGAAPALASTHSPGRVQQPNGSSAHSVGGRRRTPDHGRSRPLHQERSRQCGHRSRVPRLPGRTWPMEQIPGAHQRNDCH